MAQPYWTITVSDVLLKPGVFARREIVVSIS